MRLLLDTEVLLWWLEDSALLLRSARDAIADGGNEVWVSAATAWEIATKRNLGLLRIPSDLGTILAEVGFEELPVTVAHAEAAGALPLHHADPFDRVLVAQAQIERLTLVTQDERIAQYDVALLRF